MDNKVETTHFQVGRLPKPPKNGPPIPKPNPGPNPAPKRLKPNPGPNAKSLKPNSAKPSMKP